MDVPSVICELDVCVVWSVLSNAIRPPLTFFCSFTLNCFSFFGKVLTCVRRFVLFCLLVGMVTSLYQRFKSEDLVGFGRGTANHFEIVWRELYYKSLRVDEDESLADALLNFKEIERLSRHGLRSGEN